MRQRKDPTRPVVYICSGCQQEYIKIIAKHLEPQKVIYTWCDRCGRTQKMVQKA